MHEHPASVVVFLSNSEVVFTLADGSKLDGGGKAGDVQFADAGKHLPQNVGSRTLEGILVELKGGAAMSAAKVALDPVKVDPAHHEVVFENDRVRVLRAKFKAHDKTKQHEHPNGVAIFLTDTKVNSRLLTEDQRRRRQVERWPGWRRKITPLNTTAKPVRSLRRAEIGRSSRPQ
jgi:sulfur carrier protein ThiS